MFTIRPRLVDAKGVEPHNCGICKRVLDKPTTLENRKSTSCGHCFCWTCLDREHQLSCPVCKQSRRCGGISTMRRDTIVERNLQRVVVSCGLDCGWEGCYGEYRQHLATKCSRGLQKCNHCTQMVHVLDWEYHEWTHEFSRRMLFVLLITLVGVIAAPFVDTAQAEKIVTGLERSHTSTGDYDKIAAVWNENHKISVFWPGKIDSEGCRESPDEVLYCELSYGLKQVYLVEVNQEFYYKVNGISYTVPKETKQLYHQFETSHLRFENHLLRRLNSSRQVTHMKYFPHLRPLFDYQIAVGLLVGVLSWLILGQDLTLLMSCSQKWDDLY